MSGWHPMDFQHLRHQVSSSLLTDYSMDHPCYKQLSHLIQLQHKTGISIFKRLIIFPELCEKKVLTFIHIFMGQFIVYYIYINCTYHKKKKFRLSWINQSKHIIHVFQLGQVNWVYYPFTPSVPWWFSISTYAVPVEIANSKVCIICRELNLIHSSTAGANKESSMCVFFLANKNDSLSPKHEHVSLMWENQICIPYGSSCVTVPY